MIGHSLGRMSLVALQQKGITIKGHYNKRAVQKDSTKGQYKGITPKGLYKGEHRDEWCESSVHEWCESSVREWCESSVHQGVARGVVKRALDALAACLPVVIEPDVRVAYVQQADTLLPRLEHAW